MRWLNHMSDKHGPLCITRQYSEHRDTVVINGDLEVRVLPKSSNQVKLVFIETGKTTYKIDRKERHEEEKTKGS